MATEALLSVNCEHRKNSHSYFVFMSRVLTKQIAAELNVGCHWEVTKAVARHVRNS